MKGHSEENAQVPQSPAGKYRILITRLDGKILTALWDGKRVVEFRAEDEKEELAVGDIRIGRVTNVVKNIGAAFVEVLPGVNCFLQIRRGGKVRQGQEIVVQVIREAVSTKDPAVSDAVSLAGRYLVLVTDRGRIAVSAKIRDTELRNRIQETMRSFLEQRVPEILEESGISDPEVPEESGISGSEVPEESGIPGPEIGYIIRTNAQEASDETILAEAEGLLRDYAAVRKTAPHRTVYSVLRRGTPAWLSAVRDAPAGTVSSVLTDQPDIYDRLQKELENSPVPAPGEVRLYEDSALSLVSLYRIRHFLGTALDRYVWLKSGGFLVIDRTEAMTVIDVNSGKFSGKKQQEQTFLRINIEAAAEIAFQLRLRNLSGIIIADFIDMREEDSVAELRRVLRAELAKDPQRAELVDFTALGLAEITRKKTRRPLDEQLGRRNSGKMPGKH